MENLTIPQPIIYKTKDSGKKPKSQYIGAPTWLAGIITDNSSSIPIEAPAVNNPQYRIEQLPTPASIIEDAKKEHHYTTLDLSRPFAFMQAYLAGTPENKWDPSIYAAIAACATVSLFNRHQFVGNWPQAHVYPQGIFISAESYWIGGMTFTISTQIVKIPDRTAVGARDADQKNPDGVPQHLCRRGR
ncbi:MAG: hypothetical protein Q9212_002411 [Teloschistes hypoglaucus]